MTATASGRVINAIRARQRLVGTAIGKAAIGTPQQRAAIALRSKKLLGGASVAAIALASQAAHAQVESGSSRTIVSDPVAGRVTVSTTNFDAAKKIGFNRFTKFDVAAQTNVDLLLPSNVSNLVNVVDGKVNVNGIVTSLLADGKTGGNLFFVTTGGMFVGATGVINTGRLIVRGAGPGGLPDTDSFFGNANAPTATDVFNYGATSDVEIAGRINAPGGIDIKANTFSLRAGGTLASGAAGVAGIGAASVSLVGLEQGMALVNVDGRIAIVGASTVTVDAAADGKAAGLIDARATDTLAGGIDIASAGAIKLNGSLSAWDGLAGSSAADISVKASKTIEIGAGFSGISGTLLANFYTNSTAATSLVVGGTITGGEVSLTSDATASTVKGFNPIVTSLDFLSDFLLGKLFEEVGLGVDVYFTRADAASAVTITGAVKAQGDLTVAATSAAATAGDVSAELEGDGGVGLAIAVGIAQISSTANVTVSGTLASGGALSVTAANQAGSTMEVEAESSATAKAAAFAYTEAKVDASVNVGATAKLDGKSVTITASNTQPIAQDDEDASGFTNLATTKSTDGSAGGGSAAVMKLDIASNVAVAGAIGGVTMPDSVTVAATTETNFVHNGSTSTTAPAEDEEDEDQAETTEQLKAINAGDKEALLEGALEGFADVFDKIVLGEEGDAAEGADASEGKSTRFGAAVGVLFNDQKANVSLTGTVAASGDVAVASVVRDTSVRNLAKASVEASKDVDGEATSVSGAAAWSTTDYLSHATVGGTVTAAKLSVNAVTDRPRGTEFDIDIDIDEDGETGFSDVTSFAKEPLAKLGEKLELATGYFGNAAGAVASTGSTEEPAIAGSVSYVDIGASTRAAIDPLAVLTLSNALTVKADSTVVLLNLAGALPTESGGIFGTKGGNAAGVAIGFTRIDPTTVAEIGRGVLLNQEAPGAVNVAVAVATDIDAVSTIEAITLAPQGGQGNGLTGSGTFATNQIGGTTRATIAQDARLDLGTGALGLDALTTLNLWAVGGSIAVTDTGGNSPSETAGSVGVAGALNDVRLSTLSLVGGKDASQVAVAGAVEITARNASLTAQTTGSINAISVAGTSVAVSDEAPETPGEDEDEGAKKGALGDTKKRLEQAAALLDSSLLAGAAEYAGMIDDFTKDVEGATAAAGQDAGKGKSVTKSFGVAGSASVNLSDLTTKVETVNASFTGTGASGAVGSFAARAIEGVDMMSVTGGAAIASGKKVDNTKLISGAYGLSYSNNATISAISGGAVAGFDAVNVEAAANGTRIGAGLALSADTTGSKEGATVSASVSHLIARDGASASITDAAITGAATAADRKALSVTAYNGLRMGAGAGALSFGSSNAAGGAATVVDIAGPAGSDAASAKLVRTPVSNVTDLSVRALTGARVAGIAAAGAITGSDNKPALSAALSINLVSLDTTALIDVGDAGQGKITAGGAVSVFAGDRDPAADDALAAQGKQTGTAGAGMMSNFALGGTLGAEDPVDASRLQGGTQILSIAVPIAASRGNALGMGFAWNAIDNDRTAGIIGGGNGQAADAGTTIRAGTLSVQAIERSDILALGVGIGGSAKGAGLMGSIGRNLIDGSSSATIRSRTAATSDLVVDVTGAANAANPNVSVGAAGYGGIFSLAGAVGVGKNAAGGIAVGVNDIVRSGSSPAGDAAPTSAGLHASLDGITFKGTPDVDVLATAQGKIIATALAVAGSTSSGAGAGAATANNIAPTISASAAGLNYLGATTGDLKVRGVDQSEIFSTAIVGAVANGAGVAVGVSVNRIDADVSAALRVAAGDRVAVRNVLVDTISTAKTTSFGVGIGGGASFGGAGSVAVNLTNSDVASLLSFTGGTLTTTSSIGVVARRDLTIDVGAGVVAASSGSAAIGASIIVNDLGGSATAKIEGSNTGTIAAFTGNDTDSSIKGLRTGLLVDPSKGLPSYDGLAGFKDLALGSMINAATADYRGVAVNASSTAAARTLAITGAFSGGGAAVGITGVVNNVTGTTAAGIENANVQVGGSSVNNAAGIDVRASSQQVGLTFAGSIAGSGSVAVGAPVISDGYAGRTEAIVRGGSLASAGGIAVNAIANQASTALAAAGAVGASAGIAVAGVSPRFQSTTTAWIDRPTAIKALGSDGIAVNADSSARTLANFIAVAGGGTGAGAGAVVVATNENKTKAIYSGATGADGLGNVAVDAAKLIVNADGIFDAVVAGASVAASGTFSLVGNGVGVVHRGEVSATADALKYDRAAGVVEVKAAEAVSIAPVVGQVALTVNPISGAAALGAIAVLSQSKVDATLSRPTVNANSVLVDAKGYTQVNALQLGVAVGGIGIGANVTYIGIGKVTDTGALTATSGDGDADQKVAASAGSTGNGNRNMDELSMGGSRSGSDIANATSNATTASEKASVAGNSSARTAFTGVKTPADETEARVRAQVIGNAGTGMSSVTAGTLTIDSDTNLLSKSTNAQISAGLAAGSATIGITRNAALSIATLGGLDGQNRALAVNASGGTLNVNATTGQAEAAGGAPRLIGVSAPTNAAEAHILAGTVGIGAISVGVADVKLSSAAIATVDTNVDGTAQINFDVARIAAKDETTARTYAKGAVAGGGAVNVVVSNAVKNGTVVATMAGKSASDKLDVTATGLGGATSEAWAGSGGVIFAGNAAVASATDNRTINAIVAERSILLSDTRVTATSTPLVRASSYGIAISGGIAAGASVANATSTGTVSALIGEGGETLGSLELIATTLKPIGGDNVVADASGSAGGALVAANGASAIARTDLTTNAVLGANLAGGTGSALRQVGYLTILANRHVGQYAEATGVTAAGVLALGIQRAESRSDGTTRAAIENVDGSGRSTATLAGDTMTIDLHDASITSVVFDQNRARVTAGAGGLGAGIAADAITTSNGNAITEILTGNGKTFVAGDLTATATAKAAYRSDSDATLATLAGGSGSTSANNITSTATTNIGRANTTGAAAANANLAAQRFTIKAENILESGEGGGARGAGGGVVTGQAALVRNRLNQTALTNVRDGVVLRQAGGNATLNDRGTFIDAAVRQSREHAVTLDVGGVMQTPFAEVDGDYSATNAVSIGKNVLIRGDQGVGIGTSLHQVMTDTAAVQIYGLAGLGGGRTDGNLLAKSSIVVGDGTTIESMGDIRVSTGRSGDGVETDFHTMITQTDVFNNTLLPLSTKHDASSTINATSTLVLGNALIRSARDLIIESVSGTGAPTAAGTGHNPFLQLFSSPTKSGDTSSKTTSSITLNGTDLIAGFLNNRSIVIDDAANPNADSTMDGKTGGMLAGSKGLVIDTNNELYENGTDDWLGKFAITDGSFDPLDQIKKQIAVQKAEAAKLNLGIPIDPVDFGNAAINTQGKTRQELRDAMNIAGSQSGVIAKLATLYETKAALRKAYGLAEAERPGETPPAPRSGIAIGSLGDSAIDFTGGVFAAGGRVTFSSDTITANKDAGGNNATIKAFGPANISVTNNTERDTIVGNMFVPFKVNGAIDFSGTARAITGAVTVAPIAEEADSSILVQTGAKRNDIVVLGTVGNIAGSFRAATAEGNYIQFGSVNVANFSASSPNGLFTVALGDGTFSQGLPLAFYYASAPGYLSLYDTRPGRDATIGKGKNAIEYVASYLVTKHLNIAGVEASETAANNAYNTYYGYGTSDVMTDLFMAKNRRLDSRGQPTPSGDGTDGGRETGHSMWGSCLVNACEFASHDAYDDDGNTLLGGALSAGDVIQGVGTFDGDSNSAFDNDRIHAIKVNYKQTVFVTDPAPGGNYFSVANPKPAPSNAGQIRATQVIISAGFVDISGEIIAGPTKTRNIVINNDVTSPFFGSRSLASALGTVSVPNGVDPVTGTFNIDLRQSVSLWGGATSGENLGAQFVRTGRDAATGNALGYIKIDDVIAAGGGSITIEGKILNTNPLGGGKLTVLNGYGNISVDNRTSYDLQIGTINAGLSADGIITLRDKLSDGRGITTVYTNSIGGKVEVSQIVNGVVTQNLAQPTGTQGLTGGAALNYQPDGDIYYVWRETRNLTRSVPAIGTLEAATSGYAYNGDCRCIRYDNQNDTIGYTQVRQVGNTLLSTAAGAWTLGDGGQAPQLGAFLNINAPVNYTANAGLSGLTSTDAGADAAALRLALNNRDSKLVQIVTGKVTERIGYRYDDDDEDDGGFFIDLPTKAEISVLSAARATNPIKIEFDQGTGVGGGGINIKSNAGGRILLNGTLTFGGGTTSLETNRSIVAGEDALVVSKDVSLKAADSIGSIGRRGGELAPDLDKPFSASLIGGFIAADSGGEINLKLQSVASDSGKSAPILISNVRANGDVKITADSSVAGIHRETTGANIRSESGNVTLDVAGSVTGNVTFDALGNMVGSYRGASDLTSSGLKIDMRDAGLLTVRAAGDVSVEQGSGFGTGTTRELRIGEITTPGDVLIKAYGSIVAGDPTATIDQEKLNRFLKAAEALQLKPDCATACGIIDPVAMGGVDRAIRNDAYAAYDNIGSSDMAVRDAAIALLVKTFGSVPAAKGAIATAPIKLNREEKIGYQLRNQARDAYNLYALTNAAATAEDSRGLAVTQTLTAIDKIAALGAAGRGVTLSEDAAVVSAIDLTKDGFVPGGDLFQLAVATLTAKAKPVDATPTAAQLQYGLQLYLDDLRAPVALLLPTALPDANLTGAARTAAISDGIATAALTRWVDAQNIVSQRNRASADALGKIEQIQAFRGLEGLQLSADATKVSVTPGAFATVRSLQAGGELYELALSTLRAQINPTTGLINRVPLPTDKDVETGLQIYLDALRKPLLDLLPGALPALSGGDMVGKLDTVKAAISDPQLALWAGKQRSAASKELMTLFGTTDVTRATLATKDLVGLEERARGATWSQSMLDVQVPSSAFVPVADSQFESRAPVITARGVTLLAGNSVGAFDGQLTFNYTSAGFTGATDAAGNAASADKNNKNVAAAYLASSGPGDLRTVIHYNTPGDAASGVRSIDVITRRSQPLQLDAGGTVNAVAATDLATLAGKGPGVQGDIFINNVNALTIGSIISQKTRTSSVDVAGCNLGGQLSALCDSRIRLVAPDIIGAVAGIAGLMPAAIVRSPIGNTLLSNADGSAIVMGGLVRMEAYNGAIQGANGGAILVDTRALEVLRAAGDIKIARRSSVNIPVAGGGGYGFGNGGGISDLQLGDVFAGQMLQVDNRYGGLFVIPIASNLASENRNSRIVANLLSLGAAGDIGSSDQTESGRVEQFDIQAPVIQRFVAGFDYATGRIGRGAAPAGLGTGSGFFALRGEVQIGDWPGTPIRAASMLGARGNLTVGTLNGRAEDAGAEIKSSVTFLTDILLGQGGKLILTTDGDVNFPDETVRISGLDVAVDPNLVDLRALQLTLKGQFNYFNSRSIILGSLTAGGGVIESGAGSLTVEGTLFGNGGPYTPFTMKALKDVTVGSTGLGSIALLSKEGNVAVTGQTNATDLLVEGVNISIASGIFGRRASLTAAPQGNISIGGAVYLQRNASQPEVESTFVMKGAALSIGDLIAAQDGVLIQGKSITAASRAMFLNSAKLDLLAEGALNLDPRTLFVGIGAATLRSGTAAAGGTAVSVSSFNGGSLDIAAPVGISVGNTDVTGALTLATGGALTLVGSITAGGSVALNAGRIDFASNAGIRNAQSVLMVADTINATTATMLQSRGELTVVTRDNLNLGAVTGTNGMIAVSQGNLAIGGTFASNGSNFRVSAGGAVSIASALVSLGNMSIGAGGDLSLGGVVTMRGGSGASTLDLNAGGRLVLGSQARIVAQSAAGNVRANADSVEMDAASSITGAAVSVNARGAAMLGNILASEAQGQTVTLRAGGAMNVGMIEGGSTLVSSAGGSVLIRAIARVGSLVVSARDDATVAKIIATSAAVNAGLGSVTLGATRIMRLEAPSTATLMVTAAKAITLTGATTATGGISLTASSIATTGAGHLHDTFGIGAMTTLRADTMNVAFDTGTSTGPAGTAGLVRIDAMGLMGDLIQNATFRLSGVRGYQFDRLAIAKGFIQATTVVRAVQLTMRDWLVIANGAQSVAMVGTTANGAPPAATRTVTTGGLTKAKLVTATAPGQNHAVTVNGVAR